MLIYFAIINIVGFFIMLIDKNRARNKQWRIRERTLFLLAIFGGSIGVYCGMFSFHHKTKHTSFMVGIPIIIVMQTILMVTLYYKYEQYFLDLFLF